jgi:hypothetical protein
MSPGGSRRLAAAFALVVLLVGRARADVQTVWSEGEPRPTLIWLLTQVIPSPEVAVGEGPAPSGGIPPTWTARFGLRWQITPVLYSFGLNPRVSPWRSLVVEPLVRQSGSIEAFVSPELFTGSLFATPMVRAGVRSYFPLVAKGEELSISLGSSVTYMNGVTGIGYELGAYVLYGVVGVQVTYAPEPSSPVAWITTLRIRYF